MKNFEYGVLCIKKKEQFWIQLAKDLAYEETICKDPHIPDIDIPTVVSRQTTGFEFKGSQNLGHFAANKEWRTTKSFAIKHISKKEMTR